MHTAKILVALAMMVYMTDGLFLGGVGIAGLIGLKALFLKGAIIGGAIGYASRRRSRISYSRSYTSHRPSYRKSYSRSHSRYGRSVEDETESFDEVEAISNAILDASLNDAEDCAKKLICSLNAQDVNTLESDEIAIATLFGKTGGIDLTATTVEFDLAALMGRQAGKAQCDTIYARCPYQTKDLMEVMRKEF